MLPVIAVIAQRMRHHIFLRLRQAGKSGTTSCCAGTAPKHIGIGVVGEHTLAEVGHQFLARQGVVIKELNRCRSVCEGLGNHRFLPGCQVFILNTQCRTQLAGDQHLLVKRELVKQVVLH